MVMVRAVSTVKSACSALITRFKNSCCTSEALAQILGSVGSRSRATAMLSVDR